MRDGRNTHSRYLRHEPHEKSNQTRRAGENSIPERNAT